MNNRERKELEQRKQRLEHLMSRDDLIEVPSWFWLLCTAIITMLLFGMFAIFY